MQWELLTSEDFAEAVKATGVCVIAAGVVERHGTHLPLGTDLINCHAIARLAAEKEPAVVFPPFYFGQIFEARCYPGTLAFSPRMLLDFFQEVFDEIGRNGFKKIVLYNGHGGNIHFFPFLAQTTLWRKKPYSLYYMKDRLTPAQQDKWEEILDSKYGGHGSEYETSTTLANAPDAVKMEKMLPPETGKPLNRLQHLPQNYSGIWWYANFPEHYSGDGRLASAEKGRKLRQLRVDSLAEFIAAVKTDKVVPALEDEFFGRVDELGK